MRSLQTNKDRPQRRPYRLSPNGLESLRASAMANRPWQWSSGPRTVAGKTRSKMNALKHGERSATTQLAWRELQAALRVVEEHEETKNDYLDGCTPKVPFMTVDWVERIAEELHLSALSRDLLLALFRSSR